jgi:purine catabolism regulator
LLQEDLEPAPADPVPRADLAARAAACGIDVPAGVRVAVLRGDPAGPAPLVRSRLDEVRDAGLRRLSDALGTALLAAGIPHLRAPHGDGVTLLVQGSPDLEDVVAELREGGHAVVCGLGREVADVASIPRSRHDAEVALAHGAGADGRTVARYEDLDLARWLVAEIGPGRVGDKARAVLAPLDGRPELRQTLVEYLRQSMDVPATARALHVHQNSLRYRLTRIEQLLDRRLHDAADLAAIHIALLTAPAVDDASAGSDDAASASA